MSEIRGCIGEGHYGGDIAITSNCTCMPVCRTLYSRDFHEFLFSDDVNFVSGNHSYQL